MLTGKGEGQVDGRHALTDSAFPAHDDQLVLDAGHAGLDLLRLLRNLLDDLGVVGIPQPAKNSFQIFFRSHDIPSVTG